MKKRIIVISTTSILVLLVGFFAIYRFGDINPLISKIEKITRPYPELKEPKTVTLTCDYHGDKLSLEETVYASLDNYYSSDPKKKVSYSKNDNKSFVFNHEQDKTLDKVTNDIKEVAAKKNLNSDQTLDLASCFLQSIPYDDEKAQKVLSTVTSFPTNEIIPRYPYETLYDFTGICTDKSFLGAAIYSRLGYKTSLLSFDQDRHLSIGIGVPINFSQLGTNGYAVMELTGKGFLVGEIPSINGNIGLAESTFKDLPEITDNGSIDNNVEKRLSNASRVEVVSDGKDYDRIVLRVQLRNQIDEMYAKIETEKQNILTAQNNLKDAESLVQQAEANYKRLQSEVEYRKYTQVYNSYSNVYNATKNQINIYNSLIKSYNNLVKEYKEF